ncbi:hypothetical protein [Desulfoluna spongiiphila]|uniref:Uncharacterized protein n=1 Tax=Desulfoluna spongiiphila TaxID=419481 RepID=A0A1G5JLR4_9BACT|nr:hypothetical protein [Desulfoluna spongiiphila]SCY88861.1 hypothetical protein SAMN05216233_13311 [Desulfoluna spongiiphila]VVS93054.1 hypothetical protein DBB_26220 [Desulfoluna spongiiphila]
MTVVPLPERLKKALVWAAEERQDHPDKGRLALVDEAGMRFNLSPAESEALARLLAMAPRT